MFNSLRIAAVCLIASIGASAHAASIDFESVSPTQFGDPILNADGFDWDFTASGWFIGDPSAAFYPNGVTNGTNILVASGSSSPSVTMMKTGGGAFDVASLWATGSSSLGGGTIRLLGSLMGGGSVTTTLTVGTSFSQYFLSGFNNLMSLSFTSGSGGGYQAAGAGFALDDFDLVGKPSPVPVPAALPLMLVGIGSFAFIRRRRKN